LLRTQEGYFWGTHQGAELDLLIHHQGKRFGFEMKMSDAPSLTKSMNIALENLKLDRLFVVYPGREAFALSKQVEVLPIFDLPRSPC
jgi:predicted AAA+ superfamily ATPase